MDIKVLEVITGTPLWVWGVLVFLLYAGYQATKTRNIVLPKLFIIPLIFMGLNYSTFITGTHLGSYLIALLLFIIPGYIKGHDTPIKIHKQSKTIQVPGNYYTICIMLSFFTIKYTFECLAVMQPTVANDYALEVTVLSAGLSGFFLGRSMCYVKRFYTAT